MEALQENMEREMGIILDQMEWRTGEPDTSMDTIPEGREAEEDH